MIEIILNAVTMIAAASLAASLGYLYHEMAEFRTRLALVENEVYED